MADDRVTRTSDKEITRMWRVYRTVMEMVYDRVRASRFDVLGPWHCVSSFARLSRRV